MTSWIERLHQKKLPYSPETGDKSAKSVAHDAAKKFIDHQTWGDKSAKSPDQGEAKKFIDHQTWGDKSAKRGASVTSGTPIPVVFDVFSSMAFASAPEVMIVPYQRFFWDYDLPDGTYTPEELRRARKVARPGPELRYRLRWPGGTPAPITDHLFQNAGGR